MPILVLLFIVVPIAELAVIIRVGSWLGVLETIVLLFAVSVVGAWLAKREGLGVYRRFRQEVSEGRVPGAEIVDGVLVIVAPALLLTPGFLTDAVAILLLIPPVRAGVRRWLRLLASKRALSRLGPWGMMADVAWRRRPRPSSAERNPRTVNPPVEAVPAADPGEEDGREL